MKVSMSQLGEFVRQFCRQRGITLHDALPTATSGLSRFESGITNLSSERFHLMMNRIGLMYSDLDNTFLKGGYTNDFNASANALIAWRYAPQAPEAQSVIKRYLKQTVDYSGKVVTLNKHILSCIQESLAFQVDQRLTPDDQQAVFKLLSTNIHWLTYDFLVLRLAISHLDSATITRLVFLAHQRQADAPVHYAAEFARVVQQAVLVLWCRNELDVGEPLIEMLDGIEPNAYWVEDMFTKQLLMGLTEAKNLAEQIAVVKQLTDQIEPMGLNQMCQYAQDVLRFRQTGLGVLL